MGIPYYFASLIRKHPRIAQRVRAKLHASFLGIDFNCLIHNYLDDARPIESVLEAIEMILRDVCSADRVFIAMDGLVPYAKIVQQRYRRFRKSTAEVAPIFDRHQISPGTPYMRDLATAVRARFPDIEVSCTAEPGEGEHKIFQKMKTSGEDTVIYGLDADLILLSLPHPNVRLLRENPDFQIKASGFSALSIRELAKVLPLPVPQYVALCVLCFGNDFMPSLGMFSLREGGHERALDLYKQAGNPDMLTPAGRAHFLNFARAVEMDVYKARGCEKHPSIISSDMKHFEARYVSHILDGPVDMSAVVRDFWKCFHWTMIYFTTNNAPDWNYVYSYPEAPLVSQILRFPEEVPKFEKVEPIFTVTKQLQFILPSASLRTAKKRVMFPDELYNEDSETRIPWMRKYAWESDPRISLPLTSDCGVLRFFPIQTSEKIPATVP